MEGTHVLYFQVPVASSTAPVLCSLPFHPTSFLEDGPPASRAAGEVVQKEYKWKLESGRSGVWPLSGLGSGRLLLSCRRQFEPILTPDAHPPALMLSGPGRSCRRHGGALSQPSPAHHNPTIQPPTLPTGSTSSCQRCELGQRPRRLVLCNDGGGGSGRPSRYGGASVSGPGCYHPVGAHFPSRIPSTWSCCWVLNRCQSHKAGHGLFMLTSGGPPTRPPSSSCSCMDREHLHFPMKARRLSNMRTDQRISAHAKANTVDPFLLHSYFSPSS